MKGAYKRSSSRRHAARRGGSHDARRRDRRRNRGIGGILLILFVLLAVVAITDYLLNDSALLRTAHLAGPAENEEAATADLPEAEVGGEDAADQGAAGDSSSTPQVLLGEFFTDYAWDPDEGRQSNLKTASGKIDGTTVAPGETFSALDNLGSPEDYQAAKVFADGGVARTEGGGLCQVSSTLYMAANYAGLDIVERNPHYAELPYIRPGFDATVWFGNVDSPRLDMQFKNNTDGPVLLREFVNDDGFLVAQIYGDKPTGKTVSMDTEKVDEDLSKGIKWNTYKTVTDENGKVLRDGVLFDTTYSYNPPVPAEFKHETNEPRGSGWLDLSNTTGWNNDKHQ